MFKSLKRVVSIFLVAILLLMSGMTGYERVEAAAGEYFTSDDVIALDVELQGVSTNAHTRPMKLWVGVEGGQQKVFLAVKSTHEIYNVELGNETYEKLDKYEARRIISVDGINLDIDGLQGSGDDNHFTVALFPIDSINISEDLQYSFKVEGEGRGHDVDGTIEVKVPKVSGTVTKTWVGGPKMPVDVQLFNESQKQISKPYGKVITLTGANPTYEWTNLPYRDSLGYRYEYTIEEEHPGQGYDVDFASSYSETEKKYYWTLTNTYSAKGSYIVEASKTLENKDLVANQFDFELLNKDGTVIATATNDATGAIKFNALNFTTEDIGKTFKYTIKEKQGSEGNIIYDYTEYQLELEVKDNDDGTLSIRSNISNSQLKFNNTWQVRDIKGRKQWVDGNNQDGIRPENLVVTLYADGVELELIPEWTEENNNVWEYTFAGLPVNTAEGNPITYTVAEEFVDGYDPDQDGFDFTNTHTPDTINITGTKTWDDNDNQDGIRPEDLEVTLYANDIATDHVATWEKNGNVWTYTFKDVAVNANGEEIEYTVGEEVVEDYEADQEGFDFINSYEPAVKDITGTKTWDDNDDQDGKRPEDLVVTLFADGEELELEAEWVKEDNVWTYTFKDVAVNANGEEIDYTVEELEVEGYDSEQDGFDFTNSYEPAVKDITGTKTWVDNDNQDGIRPEDLVVTLFADGEELELEAEWVKEDNVWTYTFKDVAVNANGEEIDYTVEELEVEGYDSKQDGFNFTNTHKPAVKDIIGTKTWDDNNDRDGKRPKDLVVTLLANGEATDLVPTWVKSGNIWTYTFKDVAVNANGKPITYTVVEEDVAGYQGTKDGFNFTNSYRPEKTKVVGTKIWNDNHNQDGKRPKDLIVTLYANGEKVDLQPTWIKKGNVWTYTFADLDKYAAGKKIVYTVREGFVPGYYGSQKGYNFVNTHKPEKTIVIGTKYWNDNHNQDGKRPKNLIVTLYANGKKVDLQPTWIKKGSVWTYTFAGLDKYAAGKKIIYTVREGFVPGYYGVQKGYNFINTHKPEKTIVIGTKYWNDNNNQDGKRPDNLIVTLYANGKKVDLQPTWIKKGNVWTYTFLGLDKYAAGKRIVYTVEEEAVEGYESSQNGFNFINSREPEVIDITGTKTWDDANNQDGIRPEELLVTLFANGVKLELEAEWVKEGNVWTYTFKDVDKYAAGEEIDYTVEEEAVEGYESSQDGFDFINSYEPEEPVVPVDPEPEKPDPKPDPKPEPEKPALEKPTPEKPDLPKTGSAAGTGGLGMILLGLGMIVGRKKKEK